MFVDGFCMGGVLHEERVDTVGRVNRYGGPFLAHPVDLSHDPEESLGGNVLDEMTHVYPADTAVLQGYGFILDVADNIHTGQGSDIQTDIAFPLVRSASDVKA
jgi:hypothetical protein